jgi:zinc transporter, ZIP family
MPDTAGTAAWISACGWAFLVSLPLLAGAWAGLYAPLKHRAITSVMAVGAGILVAAATLDLIVSAAEESGPFRAGVALVTGAAVFSFANLWFSRHAAKHRKRCGECVQQPTERGVPGSGAAIAAGTLMDAFPEAIVLGLETTRVGMPGAGLLAAFALGNFAEALSSASGMQIAGRSKRYIFGLWTLAVLAATFLAGISVGLSAVLPRGMAGICNAFAAGALLAMVVETMIPEASHETPPFNGLLAVLGFLFVLILVGLA